MKRGPLIEETCRRSGDDGGEHRPVGKGCKSKNDHYGDQAQQDYEGRATVIEQLTRHQPTTAHNPTTPDVPNQVASPTVTS